MSFKGTVQVDPRNYQMLVLASALDLWRLHNIRANSSYTPGNMRRAAEGLCNRKFGARDYAGMARALRALVAERTA